MDNNTQKEEEKPKCESCYDKGYYTQMYNTIGSEDFGGEGFETGSKIPCKECISTPPTDSNWEKELRDDIFIPDGHIGLTRRELYEIIDKANGKQKEDFISDICLWLSEREEKVVNFIKQTLQQERQREREKMIEEKEQLLKEVLKFVPVENQVKLLEIVLELKNKEDSK